MDMAAKNVMTSRPIHFTSGSGAAVMLGKASARVAATSAKNVRLAKRWTRTSLRARARTSGSGPVAPVQLDCHEVHSESVMLPLLLGDRSAQSISGTAEADGNVLNGDADDDG